MQFLPWDHESNSYVIFSRNIQDSISSIGASAVFAQVAVHHTAYALVQMGLENSPCSMCLLLVITLTLDSAMWGLMERANNITNNGFRNVETSVRMRVLDQLMCIALCATLRVGRRDNSEASKE